MRNFYFRFPYFITLICGFLTAMGGLAQSPEALFKSAEAAYKKGDISTAKMMFQQIISSDSNNYQVLVRLSELYKAENANKEAVQCLNKAIQVNDSYDQNYFEVGVLLKKMEKYAEAKQRFEQFRAIRSQREDKYTQRAANEILGCELAIKESALHNPYRAAQLSLNSTFADAHPVILDQKNGTKKVLFVTNRFQNVNKNAWAIYTAEMKNDSSFNSLVTELENAPKKLKKRNAFSATCSQDGLHLYFAGNKLKPKFREQSGLWEMHYDLKKQAWSKPKPMKTLLGTKMQTSGKKKGKKIPSHDLDPAISADGLYLAFASDRDGSLGGYDIWVSQRTASGWSKPVNAGMSVNTAFDEITPYLNGDGSKLYFSSEAKVGFGGQDIYMVTGKLNAWSEAENVGLAINSAQDDMGAYWLNDTTVLLASNRQGGAGGVDLYRAVPLRIQKEDLKFTVVGSVVTAAEKALIPHAKVSLNMKDENGEYQQVKEVMPAQNKGKFSFDLQARKQYKIVAVAEGYMPNEVEVDTRNIVRKHEREKTTLIELEKMMELKDDSANIFSDYYRAGLEKEYWYQYKINNIFYDYDKYNIRADAAAELDKLTDLMTKHPYLVILISSHTDTKASPEYNQNLSELRAQSAVKYMVDKGIDPGRLNFMGMGEKKPIYYPEKNDYEMQVNRRTEFRITDVNYEDKKPNSAVIKTDPPKQKIPESPKKPEVKKQK